MIKRIILILVLLCIVVSCGKKGDPKIKETQKKLQFQNTLLG
tara:strand:- start:924 stop:1049 length:126 start_codon:yes stop_codon:yes gene_type:complete